MEKLKDISVQFIKGVGPARQRLFANLGVETVEDLLYLFPRRYEDRRQLTPIAQAKVGEFQTICGAVMVRGARRSWHTRKHVSEIVVEDKSGRLFCVWFNQPYLDRYFRPGQQVILYGKVELFKNRLQMVVPEYELIDKDEDLNLSTGRVVSIYPLTRGMTQRYLRKVMRQCIDRWGAALEDHLPVTLRNRYRLHNIRHALEFIHFPETPQLQEEAHRRISFEEFFFFQLAVYRRRMTLVRRPGVTHLLQHDVIRRFAKMFPFSLTRAQERVMNQIAGDMQKASPMLRLLQGDVGSGKTVVALFGCVLAFTNGKQSAIMAPTEILARQHYENISRLLAGSPFSGMRVALLLSAIKKPERDDILAGLKNGAVNLVIGTHALLSEGVDFQDLSFVVIDEQHKFGVRQRALLSAKGSNPDVLVMTATPIPRTLGLTLFGDLDVSTLDELPAGRGQVRTRLFSSEQTAEVYRIVRQQVQGGKQAYIVYPLVEESAVLDLKAAEKMFAHFRQHEFKDLSVGMVHGQMNREETESVMKDFKTGKIQVLVATTVLEVGVDVPNAGVMVIEHAQHFGLAQLHQLRGRIGRGKDDGLCLLVADQQEGAANPRLEAILATTDGFKIAEQDLLIRGPGHYFGRHQHGLNELRFANPLTEIDLLELARKEAQDILHQDPELAQGFNQKIGDIIQQRYPTYLAMVASG